jgi:malonyl-CoA O-methyltransferase
MSGARPEAAEAEAEARRRIAAYYDDWASYEEDWRRTDLTEVFVGEWLAAHAAPGHRVLDVGCGPGQFTRHLPPEIAVIGIDISPAMLERARAGRPAGDFHLHSYRDPLPAALGRFDCIIAIGCLEFCADLGPVLGHLAAALTPGARMLLNIAERQPDQDAAVWIESLGASLHVYSREEVEAALAPAGLAAVDVHRRGAYRNHRTGDVPPYLFWDLSAGSRA